MNIQLTNIYDNQCKHCGKQFDVNHGNRKFCKPPSKTEKENGVRDCKVIYNNQKAKKQRDIMKEVNNQAAKNLKILQAFYSKGIFTVTGLELLSKGFDPNKSTNRLKDSNDAITIPVYYIFQLINLGNDKFLIKKYEQLSTTI